MTDLTILIAVIALALWPIVFLISRILHERNKRAKPSGDTASAETEEVTEEMTTSALIMSILQQLGCQPEVNEENHISFKYQGDDFLVAAEDGLRLIIVWNPWWASISIDNQALPYLKEIINAVNMNSLVTTVYALDEEHAEAVRALEQLWARMKKHLVSTVNAICSLLPKKRSRKKVSPTCWTVFSLPTILLKKT